FVDDWAGVAAERPGVALAMTIFLLSLGGGAPTGGFLRKFYLFTGGRECRLVRKVLPVQGGDGVAPALLAGGAGRAEQRGQRLLLPAHRRRDVLQELGAAAGADRGRDHARRAAAGRDRGRAAGRLPRHLRRLGRTGRG